MADILPFPMARCPAPHRARTPGIAVGDDWTGGEAWSEDDPDDDGASLELVTRLAAAPSPSLDALALRVEVLVARLAPEEDADAGLCAAEAQLLRTVLRDLRAFAADLAFVARGAAVPRAPGGAWMTLERRVSERTTELEAANASLTGLLAERKMLLREVDHRAKNSLMIASSLLSVQTGQQDDPAVQAVLEQAQSRLRAMARAHDLLSLSDDSRQVALADYLRAVCASLTPPDADSAIRIMMDAEDSIPISADQAVPVSLIVNELITNALKHAFPPPTGGTIEVRALRCTQHQDKVVLTVSDDGVGMPAGRKGNLGLSIVRALARQIGAEIEMGGNPGVAVKITFAAA